MSKSGTCCPACGAALKLGLYSRNGVGMAEKVPWYKFVSSADAISRCVECKAQLQVTQQFRPVWGFVGIAIFLVLLTASTFGVPWAVSHGLVSMGIGKYLEWGLFYVGMLVGMIMPMRQKIIVISKP